VRRAIGVSFKGLPQLRRRMDALDDLGPFMRDLALSAVAEEKKLAPVKTGNLRRSIHVGRVTDREAEVIAGAEYAAHVEFGTRAHEIRPRSRKALRWKDGSRTRFAKVVRHPGTKAQPFMISGAERAIAGAKGLREAIINRWNNAA
jgi:hypothetical protein